MAAVYCITKDEMSVSKRVRSIARFDPFRSAERAVVSQVRPQDRIANRYRERARSEFVVIVAEIAESAIFVVFLAFCHVDSVAATVAIGQ